jgi:hypothetical protein
MLKLLAPAVVLMCLGFTVSQVRSDGSNAVQERYSFSEEKPQGQWSVGAVPDLRQAKDAVTPVVVSGTTSLLGKDQWAGAVKVTSVKLTNRSTSPVKAVRLGWVITNAEARENMRLARETVVLEGTTRLFEVNVPAGETLRIDSPVIDFIKEAKPLIERGFLKGNFTVKVRISEAHFSDSLSWREGETVTFLKTSYRPLISASSGGCSNTHCTSSNSDGRPDACVPDTQPGLTCWINYNSCGDGYCMCNNDVCAGLPD